MSYHDVPEGGAEREIGRSIYMKALSGRRGFRDDQIGIDDPETWAEVFEAMGKVALKELVP
jgi:hypothetical protein